MISEQSKHLTLAELPICVCMCHATLQHNVEFEHKLKHPKGGIS